MGGIIIGYEIGKLLGKETIFCERVNKKFELRRGFSIKKNSRVLIVEECRKSGSYGEGLLSDLQVASKSSLKIKLHAAQDSFIPIGEGATSTLPNKDSIVKIAQELYNE